MGSDETDWTALIMDTAEQCVAPVWASLADDAPPDSVDHNGTITFIDTGQRRIAVTAHHVIQKFRDVAQTNPQAGFAINLGNAVTRVFPTLTVIDEDRELDIAVLDLPPLSTWKGHDKRYFVVRTWPIPLPPRGSPVTVVGFPGVGRRSHGTFGTFSPAGYGMVVSNDAGRNVMLVDVTGTLRTEFATGETRPGGIDPGGMSGAAGFFPRDGWFHLAGFVYEGSPEMLFLTPASVLNPDGTIARR